jgi:metalloendopeptidase OMA1, mitochondrial
MARTALRRALRTWPHKLLILLALAGASCQTVPYTGRSQLNLVSQNEEIQLGVQAYQEVRKDPKTKLITSGAQYDMVQRVAKAIAAAADRDAKSRGAELGFQWEAILIDSPTVNAWCLPGGKMGVYTGILPVTQSEAGLAVVMGHEVSHAVARHGAERMTQGSFAQAVDAGLSVGLSRSSASTRSAVMGGFGVFANYGVLLPFSRTHESEADHIGLILMAEAGYDPREGPKLWQRMLQASGSGPMEILSTHPSPETRIQDMEHWMPEILEKYYKPAAGGHPSGGAAAKPKNLPSGGGL